jgi:hypothetical protein
MRAGLRPTAKAVDLPPDSNGGAPALYPTIERMVSESPGRNGSKRTGGPEILKPRRPSLTVERRRQHGPSQLADAAGHSGGVIATAR